jgi:hypothetical protein
LLQIKSSFPASLKNIYAGICYFFVGALGFAGALGLTAGVPVFAGLAPVLPNCAGLCPIVAASFPAEFISSNL